MECHCGGPFQAVSPFSGAAPGLQREEVRGVCRWVGRSRALASLQDGQELRGAAGAEGSAASGRAGAPRPRPGAGGVTRPTQRRAPAPPRAHAPARGPGRGQREGPARGGEGAGPPGASGRGSPGGGGSGGGGRGGNVPAASDPRPPVRPPAPRRGALSTARGEYLPRRPPRGRPRGSPGRGRRGAPRLAPLGSIAQPGPPRLLGCLGAHGSLGAPGPAEVPGQRGQRTDPLLSGESPPRFPASVSSRAFGEPRPWSLHSRAGQVHAAQWCGRVRPDCVWVVFTGPGGSPTGRSPHRTEQAPGAGTHRPPQGALSGVTGEPPLGCGAGAAEPSPPGGCVSFLKFLCARPALVQLPRLCERAGVLALAEVET